MGMSQFKRKHYVHVSFFILAFIALSKKTLLTPSLLPNEYVASNSKDDNISSSAVMDHSSYRPLHILLEILPGFDARATHCLPFGWFCYWGHQREVTRLPASPGCPPRTSKGCHKCISTCMSPNKSPVHFFWKTFQKVSFPLMSCGCGLLVQLPPCPQTHCIVP